MKKLLAALALLALVGVAVAQQGGGTGGGGSGTVTSVACATTTITTSGTCYSRGQVIGTNTNDAATAGNFGEVISSNAASPGTTLTTGTAANITNISLTAGDWQVWGNICLTANATTTSSYRGWINATSATEPTRPNGGSFIFVQDASITSGASDQCFSVGQMQQSLSGTTTIYLSVASAFAGGTANTAYGFIGARRAR